jgi:hypothetical protein
MNTATREELMTTAPDGLYLVSDGERKVERLFDIPNMTFTTGPTSEYGRVMEKMAEFPVGVELVTVRPDGRMVIFDRVLDASITESRG